MNAKKILSLFSVSVLLVCTAFMKPDESIGPRKLLFTAVSVYVRVNETDPTQLCYIGAYDITLGTNQFLITNITDTRPLPDIKVSRIARDVSGTPILKSTSSSLAAPNGKEIPCSIIFKGIN